MPKLLTFVSFVFLLLACRKTYTSSFEKSFPGFYKVTKITSSVPVDLNNDRIKTANIYAEISDPHKTHNGELVSFHDFQQQNNYLEVRPLPDQLNASKLISFNFPHQIIDYFSNNTPYLVEYNNEFLIYTYKFNNDRTVEIASSNPDYTNQLGVINSLIVKANGVLVVQLKKQIFDFFDHSWKQIDLTAEYSKMP
ncbi:hypothetical protein [Lacibacter sp.]|jgi:hypothetical protein|uniref:hypothetical protein n=1 Tax=Lacibacter sp. TaxID=1915409 RepID=UPI002B4B5720|nr:hypothetical protein [Lacibacter sp.]HLP37997.1 hypothetical protein [Lacibacter sp.]